jgi:uncharacterized protein YaaR (DUF327 family)
MSSLVIEVDVHTRESQDLETSGGSSLYYMVRLVDDKLAELNGRNVGKPVG